MDYISMFPNEYFRSPVVIDEGDEPPEFWACLGGKGKYTQPSEKPRNRGLPARLFHCYTKGDFFFTEEVINFTQEVQKRQTDNVVEERWA